MRPRLLLITQDFPPAIGGIQTYSFELANALHPLCEAFAVVAPRASSARAFDADLPFPVHRVLGASDLTPIAAAPAILKLAASGKYRCTLHAQWATAPAALIARRIGVLERVVVAAHGRELLLTPFHGFPALQRRYDRHRSRVLRATDRVFAVSTYTAGLVSALGVAKGRVRVIPNATNSLRFGPTDRASARAALGLGPGRLLLSVARLVPRKGVEIVLRALPALIRELPDLRYVVAGRGPDAERLSKIAGKLRVSDRVRFVDHVAESELPLWYAACDVFVMPARSEPPDVEGFGLVFLEAGACERPVVGARAGGVVDAIVDGTTGLLVTPGSVDELTASLLRLLRDPQFAARLGRAGRARVEAGFTWQHVGETMTRALTELGTSSRE
jgi:phosphatidylinositol alpha-1,6-mannosyltransferase